MDSITNRFALIAWLCLAGAACASVSDVHGSPDAAKADAGATIDSGGPGDDAGPTPIYDAGPLPDVVFWQACDLNLDAHDQCEMPPIVAIGCIPTADGGRCSFSCRADEFNRTECGSRFLGACAADGWCHHE